MKDHKDNETTGASLLWGKAEKPRAIQLEEKEAERRILPMYINTLREGKNRIEPGSF